MPIVDKTTLKSYFETNDVPTQAQFEDLIDTLSQGGDNIHIDETNEIIAASASTYFDISGNDLNKVNTLTLEDANVTSNVLIKFNLLRVYVDTGAAVGKKDLTINGVLYSDYIDVQLNAGFTYLGSNDGFTYTKGTDDSKDLEVVNNSYYPIQDALGIKPTTIPVSFASTVKFNKFKFKGDQTLEVIFDWVRKSGTNDYLYLGIVESDVVLNASTNYALNNQSRAITFLKTANNCKLTSLININGSDSVLLDNALPMSLSTSLPTTTTSACLKYVINNETLKIYSLSSRNDTKGELLFQYAVPLNAVLDSNKDYSLYFTDREQSATEFRIQAIKII